MGNDEIRLATAETPDFGLNSLRGTVQSHEQVFNFFFWTYNYA